MTSFARALKARKEEEFFHESFTRAVLKASLSVITIFAKFLNSIQLESLLKNTLIVDKAYEGEVEAILNVVSSEGPRTVGLKQLFQAVFNCFDEVLAQDGAKGLSYQTNLPIIAIRYFSRLLKPVMMRMKKDFCAEHFKKIS